MAVGRNTESKENVKVKETACKNVVYLRGGGVKQKQTGQRR